MGNKAHIIAEAGVNHNGSLENAKKLVDIAFDCDADSVKFQIINPWGLYLPGNYKYGHYDIEKVIEMRFETVLKDEDYYELKSHSDSKPIALSASVFDEDGLDLITKLNPPYIKVASCDLNNVRFLRMIAERGIKIILSTGMSTLKEIDFSLEQITSMGMNDIVLLHCVSIYPSPLEKTNLGYITTLQEKFGFEVGFSDHTRTNEASIAAYMLGARWFEKHFTYDQSLPGFDHKHAQNTSEFRNYIAAIRAIEESLVHANQKVSDPEKYTAQRARRSLYAAEDLKAGQVITNDHVLCVRPEGVMNANQIDLLIGKRILQDIKQHEAFTLNHVSS